MSEHILQIDHLAKTYGEFRAVDAISLQVEANDLFALLGPNGAGKTTTIRMLMGILQPSAGTARICGLDCFGQRAEVQRHVGYVPDEPVFYDYLRGAEIIRFVGEMRGLRRADADRVAGELIDRLELDDALGEFAVNYSKGMKKKLALICALVHEPALLILDEPSSGLDPFATRTLQEVLRECAGRGTAVFYSTHLLDQAERLCRNIAILHKGRLAASGPLAELRAELAPSGSLEDVFFEAAARETEPADAPPNGADDGA
ncbi:MAG: ABC transporter ATP-binding protein [Planctomycetota bacterium]